MIAWVVVGVALAVLYYALGTADHPVPKGFYKKGSDRRFFLTGCASGIGRHMARVLLERGHRVCACDKNVAELRRVAEDENWRAYGPEGSLLILEFDVSSYDAWGKALDAVQRAWDGVDVLFNIAGYMSNASLPNATERDINLTLDVNAKGAMFGTQLAVRRFAAQPTGVHIVNIASVAALMPVGGMGVYAASKCALRGFCLAASKDLRGRNAFITCLCPDGVTTPMTDRQAAEPACAVAYATALLTVRDVERCVLETVLPRRPVEAWLTSASWRKMVVVLFGTHCHSARFLLWVEDLLARQGRHAQAKLLRRAEEGKRGSI